MQDQEPKAFSDSEASAQLQRRVAVSLALLGLPLLLLIVVLLTNANTPWPMVLFVAVLSFQLGFLSHRAWRKSVQPGINLQVDEGSISRVDMQGHVTRVRWDEVARVRYVTSGGAPLSSLAQLRAHLQSEFRCRLRMSMSSWRSSRGAPPRSSARFHYQ